MKKFVGLRPGDDPRKALGDSRLGGRPEYKAELIATRGGKRLGAVSDTICYIRKARPS
jgi:hypothetical protein